MKALLAFDKYKGSLSASEACAIAEDAIRSVDSSIDVVSRPLSDGGEGFCEIVTKALGGVFRDYTVCYPAVESGHAQVGYVFLNQIKASLRDALSLPSDGLLAIVEMAQAAGHHQVPNATRNPWKYTTAGIGDMLRYARIEGASYVLLGMGGSATNDMGVGMLEALGVEAYDESGQKISPIIPENWSRIVRFKKPTFPFPDLHLRVACDVNNPLHGPEGSAAIFGPQKGLKPEDLSAMQSGMTRICRMLKESGFLNDVDVEKPGMGAAGGLPYGLMSAFETQLIPGFDLICDILNIESEMTDCDIVFTGEGALDKSSLSGKGPYNIVCKAVEHQKKVAILPGKAFPEATQHLHDLNDEIIVSQLGRDEASIEENIRNEAKHLNETVQNIVKTSLA